MEKSHSNETHFSSLTKKALPKALREVLSFLFPNLGNDVVLVGGTALSGFYFGHRKSDDIDLFVRDQIAFTATIKTILGLKEKGLIFHEEKRFPEYYHSLCRFFDHKFTIDVVVDNNLFSLIESVDIFPYNIKTPGLKNLLKMKMATLVSRCSEKDLYDLLYLFHHFKELTLTELIKLGQEIDLGLNIDSLALSIGGAILREDACNFSIDKEIKKKEIYEKVLAFQKILMSGIIQNSNVEENEMTKTIGDILKKITKLKNGFSKI